MATMSDAVNAGTIENGSIHALPTSVDSSSQGGRINNNGNASSSAICMPAAMLTSTGQGGGVTAAISGVGLQRAGKASGGVESSSPLVGIATTCHACKELRVSRTVTCKSCRATFHWSCIGFYEHLYRRPKEDWRCSDCSVEKGDTAGQDSDQEESIDVGTPEANALPAMATQSVDSLISGSFQGPLTEEAKKTSSMTVTAIAGMPTVPWTGVTSSITSPVSDAASIATSMSAGERICPVCKKDIGRKRTLDCSVCHKLSHAGCVNVRGAETPKSWVCRDCRDSSPDRTGSGEIGEENETEVVTLLGRGYQNAECTAASTDRRCPEQPDLVGQLLNGQNSSLTQATLDDPPKVPSSRSDGEVSGFNNDGMLRGTGNGCLEGEAPGGHAESEQGNSVLGRCSTEAGGTTAEVTVAQKGEKMASVGVSEEDQNNGAPVDDRGWDSDMDLTVDDSQQESLLVRNSLRKSSTKRKSLLPLPPPPVTPASLSSTETQPSTESAQASDVLEVATTAPQAPGTTAMSSGELSQELGTPESSRIPPAAPGVATTALLPLPPPAPPSITAQGNSEEEAVVPPLPPFDPPPQSGRTPPTLPGFPHSRHPSKESDVLKHSSKAPTPSSVISLSAPSPLLLAPSAPRTASTVRGMSVTSSLEMIPLGISKSHGKSSASLTDASRTSGTKATGSRAPEAGKKSFLFSEQEQKAMAKANSGADKAREPGKVLKGKMRAGAQIVSTKLKGKSVSRPKVASVFMNEEVVAKKIVGGRIETEAELDSWT